MRGQPRIMHALHLGLLGQPARERRGVGAMAIHSQREGLDSAQREEAVEGSGDAADRVLQVRDALRQRFMTRFAPDHDDTADHVGMPIEIFRR